MYRTHNFQHFMLKDKLYVFGYGSLVSPQSFSQTLQRENWCAHDFPLTRLQGYRRIWNVAMDNSMAINGYKRYSDYNNSENYPDCFVSFINIEVSKDDEVIGAIAEITANEMTLLETRERNYLAVEVTDSLLHAPIDGKVYAFVGSDDAKERFNRGILTDTAVISTDYENHVNDAFRARGATAYENYLNSTEKPDQLRTLPLKLHKL